jgi:thiol-disulfide isomerase/thioredoxin
MLGRLEALMPHTTRLEKRASRGDWLLGTIGLIALLPGAGLTRSASLAVAAPPESQQSTGPSPAKTETAGETQVSAAKLVRAWRQSQSWIDTARSFHIRIQDEQEHTDAAHRWEEKPPTRLPFASKQKKLELPPYSITTEWAWDETRIRYHQEIRQADIPNQEPSPRTRVWDGALAVSWYKSDKSEQYVLDNKPDEFFASMVTSSFFRAWGNSTVHRFWWLPIDVGEQQASQFVAPEDFELEGRELVNGRPCDVVVSRAGHRRLYFSVADGRLYRQTWLYPAHKVKGYDNLAVLRKVGGPKVKTLYHWNAWLKELDVQARRRAFRDMKIAQFEFTQPSIVQTFDDFREVAPGCWFPFRQSGDHYNVHVPKPFLSAHSETTVTLLEINKPLEDDLFHVELKDGVYVATDWRYDPIIRYTYSKDQTEEERLALCEAARQQQEKAAKEMAKRRAVIEGRIGQTPPPLPGSGWFNSKPLSWEQLRGKVVVLHFWDVNCGPCQNELPILAGWHENRANNSRIIIGIHRPTTDLAAVQKKLDDFDAKYPVLIDVPPKQPGGIGELHDWFGNSWWPHTVLINKAGVVAGHGQLWSGDIIEQLGKLALEEE